MTPPRKRYRVSVWHGRNRVMARDLDSKQRDLVAELIEKLGRGSIVGDDLRTWSINESVHGSVIVESIPVVR